MRRLGIQQTRRAPDMRRYVASCMACHHWQIDARPAAVSDFGGSRPALMAMAEAHVEHLEECPGAGGRIRFEGQWVEPPLMQSGKPSDGTMQLQPFPRWWVTR